MAPARQLFQLQQLEEELRRHQQALAETEAKLADRRVLEEASAALAIAQGKADRLRLEQRDLELAIGTLEQRVRDVETRLYGGRTTNPKELVGIQEDLKQLRRQRQEREDRLLEVMLATDDATAEVRSDAARLGQAQAERKQLEEESVQEKQRLTEASQELARRVAETIATIASQEIRLYESIKAATGGTAVARVERGICRGCGLALSSHQLQRVRLAQELVRCGSCGRILYFG